MVGSSSGAVLVVHGGRWAVNDVAPGIPDHENPGKSRGWLNIKVLRLLKDIREAQDNQDQVRVKCVQQELSELGKDLSIPIHVAGNVVVPNMTPDQKTVLSRTMRKIVKSTDTKAWEKQALMKLVRVVRSSPNNREKTFAKLARARDNENSRGCCTCHQVCTPPVHGTLRMVEGHVALMPVNIQDTEGRVLWPRDPLPVPGKTARRLAVQAVNKFAKQVDGIVLALEVYIPRTVFQETGKLLRQACCEAQLISEHCYVRVVDKGSGELWGFCKWWLWGVVEEFLRTEGYIPVQADADTVRQEVADLISEKGWGLNHKGRMCILYVIAKAKSLRKGTMLWRPIAAYPEPLLPKKRLRLAARAMTRFLKYIIDEIPNSFQCLRVNDVAQWLRFIDTLGLTTVTELDCKEQFNKIKPQWIEQHMTEGAAYLTAKRRWRMGEVVWSIHASCNSLDRASKGTSRDFRYVTHTELKELVSFELQKNNHCTAAGRIWKRVNCIPMGGSFSAQSADVRPSGEHIRQETVFDV